MITKIEKFLDSLPDHEQRIIALNAIERLIEMEEVSYREKGVEWDGSPIKESLYWSSCGEDLRYER